MSLESQIALDHVRLRREAMIRCVLDTLRGTIDLHALSPDVKDDEVTVDVVAELTDASARVIAPLVEAVEILEAIIFASDGCVGHRHCAHSIEPWLRARALLQGKWEASTHGEVWPK